MKIIIQDEGKVAGKTTDKYDQPHMESEIALDDAPYDGPGYISLEVGGKSVADIHIKDLYPAVVAFHAKYVEDEK